MYILNIILVSSSFYVHKYTHSQKLEKKAERESTDYEKLSIVVWYEGIAIKCNLWMNKKKHKKKKKNCVEKFAIFYGK